MKKLIFLIIVILSLSFLNSDLFAQITKAPDFTLTSIDGKEIKLSNYKGKKVILNFWATNCPPCKMEIPDFVKVYRDFKDKVEIIGIAVGSYLKDVERIVKEYNINYPVCMSDGKIESLYGGIRWVPTTFVIDENGYVQLKKIGILNETELRKILKGK